ncbi:MAG: OmpA family protein [Saprospiraceae bacterium]
MRARFYPFFIFTFLLILPITGSSQKQLSAIQQKEFLNAFQEGDEFLARKKYAKAKKSFEKAIAIKPQTAAVYRRLGIVHELLKEYRLAADYFETALEINPKMSRALYFQSGEMLMKVENYAKAKERLKEYENFQKIPATSFENGETELSTETYYNTLLKTYLANCIFAAHKTDFVNVEIKNLGPKINSDLDDLFPYIANNESWMFYTRNVPFYGGEDQLMYSTAEGGGWAKSKTLLDKKMREEFNQGMGKISRDEKVMFFPVYDRADESNDCNIMKANMHRDAILDINKLGEAVNSPHWESQPTVNCEGKSLYFVSDRPGGFGGRDIWVSHLQENGEWTNAVNLGPEINTEMDEESPFIADDNLTLFFASNGHPGFGETDIFYARFSENGGWGTPQNMGKPVNSSDDELSFFMTAKGDKGYIASNREGGYGNFDIYEFKMPAKKDFEEIAYIKGRVMDAVTKEPIESVVYVGDKGNYPTDEAGNFFVCHPSLSQLKVLVSERKYYDFDEAFVLDSWNSEGFVEIDIYLRPLSDPLNLETLQAKVIPESASKTPEKIEVAPVKVTKSTLPTEKLYATSDVYFYFDDFSLTQEARYNMDRLIEDLDKDQLALIIIEGFADQIGTDDYNLRLSEKRAIEVADYFKSKGYTNLKIKYKGYGETRNSFIYSRNRKVEIHVYYKI